MESIPDDIIRFIDSDVESIEQLEVLRLLGEDPAREWSASEIAQAAQIPLGAIGGQLAALAGRGLIRTSGQGPDLRCRYAPRNEAIADILARLLKLYSERPVTMIKLMYARADARLTAFADAFRIRRDN